MRSPHVSIEPHLGPFGRLRVRLRARGERPTPLSETDVGHSAGRPDRRPAVWLAQLPYAASSGSGLGRPATTIPIGGGHVSPADPPGPPARSPSLRSSSSTPAGSPSAPANAQRTTTLRFDDKATLLKIIDNPPADTTQNPESGDTVLFRADLVSGNTKIATDHGLCTVIDAPRGECTARSSSPTAASSASTASTSRPSNRSRSRSSRARAPTRARTDRRGWCRSPPLAHFVLTLTRRTPNRPGRLSAPPGRTPADVVRRVDGASRARADGPWGGRQPGAPRSSYAGRGASRRARGLPSGERIDAPLRRLTLEMRPLTPAACRRAAATSACRDPGATRPACRRCSRRPG